MMLGAQSAHRDAMKWYVLYTRPHHERTVYERLLSRSFEVFLPWAVAWQQSKSGPRNMLTPLFRRYVFVRCYLEMYTHVELITLAGAMRLLEDAEGRLLTVSEEEVRILQQLGSAGVPLQAAAYQFQGRGVQVMQGPLQGISGIMRGGDRVTLLVPIHSLRASVAVDMTAAASAGLPVDSCVVSEGRSIP